MWQENVVLSLPKVYTYARLKQNSAKNVQC